MLTAHWGRGVFGFACLILIAADPVQQRGVEAVLGPDARYEAVARALQASIQKQLAEKEIPAAAIALVDDQRIVWAQGFGLADPARKIPATAQTVFRVGSVSKLFTDIGIMQQVEAGLLDLDAPITRYLPDFHPQNPFGKAITLRQLMAHRSGLVREPPVGHYFDPVARTLAESVRSLNSTTLVYAPESRIKYSNAGVAVVGYVLEQQGREPFAALLKRRVLDPMGLERSSFEATPRLNRDLSRAVMWTYHGRTFPAPTFALGTSPAGNMYSTAPDLGRFLSVLFAGGRTAGGVLLKPQTLAQMLTPQFSRPDEKTGFGLGFHLTEWHGRKRVGHSGAVYGFATELAALPAEKLGVVVIAAKDCANAVTEHIASVALEQMLAVREGKTPPPISETTAVPEELAKRAAGLYRQGPRGTELVARGPRLFAWPFPGGSRAELRMLGPTLITDGSLDYGERIEFLGENLRVGTKEFGRQPPVKPGPIPERWRGLIGEYGWDHDILYILERDSKLYALIEWFFLYPLEEVTPEVFRFPPWGLYDGEKLIFKRRTPLEPATEVEAASVVFRRRPIPGADGETFTIRPQRPVEVLRREALAAKPPAENGDFRAPDLVDLATLDPTIKLDIRYASANNFLSTPLYSSARAFLQRPAAEALLRAHRELAKEGFGLWIFDGYRPWYVTRMFWDATPPAQRIFVADPTKGSRHNRGCAVDLTLYDLQSGRPVDMVGGYDEFSDRSYPDYPGGTSLERWHREKLRQAMEAQGFSVYEAEWWHFDYHDWRHYAIANLRFEDLPRGK